MKKYATELLKDEREFGRNWLFIYEVLSAGDGLKDNFQAMKRAKITFIRNI